MSTTSSASHARDVLSSLRDFPGAVVFGASRGAWYARRVLQHHGIRVAAFAITDAPTEPTEFEGAPVISLSEARARLADHVIVSSLLSADGQATARNTLNHAGFPHQLVDMPWILHTFAIHLSRRDVDCEAYWDSLVRYYGGAPCLQSPSVSAVLTEKCTLNCQDCGAFVPDIAVPKTFPTSTIVRDIEAYCSAFEVVEHIALQGGEPLMHKGLADIVDAVARISNLLTIDIVSNGTLVPGEALLAACKRAGACIIFSDYGPTSRRLVDAASVARQNGVFVDFHRYVDRKWGRMHPFFPRHRSVSENDEVFRRCISDKYLCCQIMNGEIHRCSVSNFSRRVGFAPSFEDDFVRIDDSSGESTDFHARVRAVALRTKALNLCDHCPGADRELVSAGIQVPRKSRG